MSRHQFGVLPTCDLQVPTYVPTLGARQCGFVHFLVRRYIEEFIGSGLPHSPQLLTSIRQVGFDCQKFPDLGAEIQS